MDVRAPGVLSLEEMQRLIGEQAMAMRSLTLRGAELEAQLAAMTPEAPAPPTVVPDPPATPAPDSQENA